MQPDDRQGTHQQRSKRQPEPASGQGSGRGQVSDHKWPAAACDRDQQRSQAAEPHALLAAADTGLRRPRWRTAGASQGAAGRQAGLLPVMLSDLAHLRCTLRGAGIPAAAAAVGTLTGAPAAAVLRLLAAVLVPAGRGRG